MVLKVKIQILVAQIIESNISRMPLNGMTKAYRAYIRERRYWRRRQRIEANRPVPSEEDDYQGPRAVGGQVTVINRERILGQRLANRDMPVVVPETQEHGPVEQPRGPVHTRRRHPDIDLDPDDSTPSLISDSESIELNTQEEGPTPAVERQDAVGHEARANVRRNAQEDEPLVPRANPAGKCKDIVVKCLSCLFLIHDFMLFSPECYRQCRTG